MIYRLRVAILAGAFALACSDDINAADTAPYSRSELLSPKTCGQCHGQHYEEWSGSMHAYASIDPVFRAMNARGQKETGGQLGDFCVNCHAPMAVREGATHDGTDLDSVPSELQGVTCYFCHDVTDVAGTHDNALVLGGGVTMRGAIRKPTKYKGHLAEYSPFFDDQRLESASLCGSCHDIVVPAHFSGASEDVPLERTFSEWKGSIFGDQTAPNHFTCAGSCHMRAERGPVAALKDGPPMLTRVRHQHDFPGVDTALTQDFPQARAQRRAIVDTLNIELRVVVCVDSNTHADITVRLENLSAGHNFPSGASQDRRLWVELHGYAPAQDSDRSSEVEVFTSGAASSTTAATDVEGTWLLRDETLKADGKTPAHVFWDAALVVPNTIPVGTPGIETVNRNVMERNFHVNRGLPAPTHVTVKVWLEPIGLDVIDDMIASGFLDAGFRNQIPRFALIPPDAAKDPSESAVTLDWTVARASVNNPQAYDGPLFPQRCIETSPVASVTLPPAPQ